MRLHNFIIENCANDFNVTEEFRVYEQETIAFIQDNPFEIIGVFNGHEEEIESGNDGVGRNARLIETSVQEGKRLRQYISDTLGHLHRFS